MQQIQWLSPAVLLIGGMALLFVPKTVRRIIAVAMIVIGALGLWPELFGG